MNRKTVFSVVFVIVLLLAASMSAAQSRDRFIGRWALTIPNGLAGWLGIEEKGGEFEVALLWSGGSPKPVKDVSFDGETMTLTRMKKIKRKDADGNVIGTYFAKEIISATVSGDRMKLTRTLFQNDGKGVIISERFTGKRIPALGAKPDLSKAKRGKTIRLLNGKNLDGWKLTDRSKSNNKKSGWSVENGTLINNPVQPEGKHISYGNLRTVAEFKDFNIKLELNTSKGSNSGVYLRGIYEVQVSESYGQMLNSRNMGAVYGRIAPTVDAVKPAGQWQTLDITLLERHVTVILNGKTIIDNQPLLGCTGGALWSDEFREGPIFLQGDHTSIKYRNIVLTPLTK
ncbi:MAG: DUF1080 domain-containing protein [Planctomycetes bacterium]|nr:DUF1080 domain-containing protein [Planctomycetota bacterium]